ncbi:MAG: hypothetical protein CV090_12730, partial [Nitrospira sp. WS238]|nr:hypothetical protein [Nitrospira sp. WS238]
RAHPQGSFRFCSTLFELPAEEADPGTAQGEIHGGYGQPSEQCFHKECRVKLGSENHFIGDRLPLKCVGFLL